MKIEALVYTQVFLANPGLRNIRIIGIYPRQQYDEG